MEKANAYELGESRKCEAEAKVLDEVAAEIAPYIDALPRREAAGAGA